MHHLTISFCVFNIFLMREMEMSPLPSLSAVQFTIDPYLVHL